MRSASNCLVFVVVASSSLALGACSGVPSADSSGAPGSRSEVAHAESTGSTSSSIIDGKAASDFPEAALVDMSIFGFPFAFCSGTVIAPKVVLTAGHCVENVTGWTVTVPFANGQTAKGTTSAALDWHNGTSENVNPNQHDVGLIFLDTPITLPSYPVIATTPIKFGSKGFNVGRIGSGTLSTTQLFKGQAITLDDGATYGFPFDYGSTDIIESGDSGGGVYAAGTAVHTLIAVNSGAGDAGDAGKQQVVARLDLVASWISDQIKTHGGRGN